MFEMNEYTYIFVVSVMIISNGCFYCLNYFIAAMLVMMMMMILVPCPLSTKNEPKRFPQNLSIFRALCPLHTTAGQCQQYSTYTLPNNTKSRHK